MQLGDEIIIEPVELVAGGDSLARVDGFPVFAANLFPGDVARVRLLEVKKGFARAEPVEILEPSSWRRTAPCPVASECGGCDWTALRLDRQLEAKQRILSESLRRIGKFDPATLPPIRIHPSPLNYRIRSRLHTDGEAVGFYAMRSNRVVPLPAECEVVGIRTAETFGSRAAVAITESESLPEIWEVGDTLINNDRELTIHSGNDRWRLSTGSFFQVNRHLLGTMLRLVSGHASRVKSRELALDLYAGVGFFSVPLGRLFRQVIAVEGSARSTRYARLNVPDSVKVVSAPVEEQISRLPGADFVFLDPPRAGARREVIETIGRETKEMIAYLSCDPVTFSRDASRLIASGWRLSTLDVLDLFPNTHHVETLSSFERAQ
jgi:tRNA/tmRNA/rRNA uracil-C5-methylase (TrmA/RlmC/RlmD family)